METGSECPSSPETSQDAEELLQQAIKRRARTPTSKNSPDNNNDVGFVLAEIEDDNTSDQENEDVCSDLCLLLWLGDFRYSRVYFWSFCVDKIR